MSSSDDSNARSRKRRHMDPEYGSSDSKATKRAIQEEGGPPLVHNRRFRNIRQRLLFFAIFALITAIFSVVFTLRFAPPDRVDKLLLQISPNAIIIFVLIVSSLSSYSEDTIVFTLAVLVFMCAFTTGLGWDFITSFKTRSL